MDHDGLKDHEYSIQPVRDLPSTAIIHLLQIDADFKTGKCAAPYILA